MMHPTPHAHSVPPVKHPYTHLAKVLVVGDAAVGKTSLLVRYVKGIFNPSYILTIGVAFFVQDVVVGDRVLRLQIWDTGGQERFGPIRRMYYRGAKGVLLVYDKSNPETFEHLDYWLKEVERGCSDVPIILVGNKADLPEAVTPNQGQEFASKHSLAFVETSAKTGLNTEKAFILLARRIIGHMNRLSSRRQE